MMVDWKDRPSYEAVISAIGSEAIWVRKVGDNEEVCKVVKDWDGEDCRYGLYNNECQFDLGGANSFSSCGKVIQINGQGECTMEQMEETLTAIDRTKAAQGWTSSPNHKHLIAGRNKQ